MKARSDVDGDIRGLVATINADGFRTYTSSLEQSKLKP